MFVRTGSFIMSGYRPKSSSSSDEQKGLFQLVNFATALSMDIAHFLTFYNWDTVWI